MKFDINPHCVIKDLGSVIQQSLRRSSRTRKTPDQFHTQDSSKNPLQTKKGKKKPNPFMKCRPSIQTLVQSDTRNLQLVTPIFETEENSVSCYLKYLCQSGIVTSNEIDQAVSSGVDLDQVSLGELYMNLEQNKTESAR